MIVTCKKHIPTYWIIFAILPWAAINLKIIVMSQCFIFSLKKFLDNPAALTFILSLPAILAIFITPIVTFLSDRIWTRYGRRKPFVLFSWAGVVVAVVGLPLAPNLWWLIAIYTLYQLFNDFGAPIEALKQEVVPPKQRGRAHAGLQWTHQLAALLFYAFALGRFDQVQSLGGLPIDGENAIYWAVGALVFVMLVLVALGFKETNQHSAIRGQRFSFGNFFRGILDRELWPVFILILAQAILHSALGPMGNLLQTEQWGFTKQELGINVLAGTSLNLILIFIVAIFADKLNRLKAFETLIVIALVIKVSYYCYVNFVLYDQRPTLVEIILFGELLSVVGMLMATIYYPLVYDFIRRNKLGTFQSGQSLVTKLTTIITMNGLGLFMTGYAALFQPQAGEMTRIVFHNETAKSEVRATMDNSSWFYPQDGKPAEHSEIQGRAWYATGAVLDTGRCWEIRLKNNDSEHLASEKESLKAQRSKTESQRTLLKNKLEARRSANELGAIPAIEDEITQGDVKIKALTGQMDAIDAKLAARAQNLKEQVRQAFGDKILTDGEQVRAASIGEALVIQLPIKGRPASKNLEKALDALRKERPDVIDLRASKNADRYDMAISCKLPPDADEESFANDLYAAAKLALTAPCPGLLGDDTTIASRSRQKAVSLDLLVIEEPLDIHLSPVTRGVNAIFGIQHRPERRLNAMARVLRQPGQTEHASVSMHKDDPRTVTVAAVLSAEADKGKVEDAVGQRLVQLLGEDAQQVKSLYDRVVAAGVGQRLSVAQPFLATEYAKIRYDYMAGYLWLFLLGLIGLSIAFAFGRKVRKGKIVRHGAQEAQA